MSRGCDHVAWGSLKGKTTVLHIVIALGFWPESHVILMCLDVQADVQEHPTGLLAEYLTEDWVVSALRPWSREMKELDYRPELVTTDSELRDHNVVWYVLHDWRDQENTKKEIAIGT